MSGQEVLPPPSDTTASSSDSERSTMTTVLLSILSVFVLLGVLGGVGFGVMLFGGSGSRGPAVQVRSEPAEVDPNYVPGPKLTEFTLTERSGDEFDSQSLKGKVWVASFFYASCPHTCLQLNQRVQKLEREFGKRGVTFLSITCDPKNDTPQRLAKYADGFGADKEQWLFLTGDVDYIGRVGSDMFSATVGEKTHSERVYIVDKRGTVRGHFVALNPIGFDQARTLIKKLLDEPYEPQSGEPEQPAESAGS